MTVDKDLLLVLKSSQLGDGEPDLGAKLMGAFLATLLDSGPAPARIICMNSAIFLTTTGSPVQELLKKFEAGGSEVLSCQTCLDYYGRRDQLVAGKPTNMRDTVAAMRTFARVLAP
jgi:selenium metabolism protein YedF